MTKLHKSRETNPAVQFTGIQKLDMYISGYNMFLSETYPYAYPACSNRIASIMNNVLAVFPCIPG
jgi:hypothetical protein